MFKKATLIGVAVVIVAVGFLWWLGGVDTGPIEVAREEVSGARVQSLTQPDQDGDGLKDWEEAEWGTDPSKADSDGDGTSDGEEVSEYRQPLSSSPSDAISDQGEQALALVRNGNRAKQAPLVTPSAGNYEPGFRYALTDLTLTSLTDEVALTEYGKALGAALALYGKENSESDLALVLRAHEKRDEAAAAALAAITAERLGIVRTLAALPVPETASAIHLNLINAILGVAELDYHLARIFEEPLLALDSTQVYPGRYQKLLTAIESVNRYFLASGISFAPAEQTLVFTGFQK